MYLGKWGDLYLILYIFVWKFKVSLNYFQTGGGDGGHLKLVRGWHCNKEGGWFSQVKVENVFDFESSFLCFPLFLLFNSCPSWHQNRKLRWVSYLVTHFACFDLSVPVANWFWVRRDLQALGWSLFIKACFQEITGICEIPLVKCIWSKYFLDPHRAGPVIMSSLMSPGAHRCLGQPEELCYCLQTELASCFQKVVVIPWSPLAISFFFHLFIFLELYKFVN